MWVVRFGVYVQMEDVGTVEDRLHNISYTATEGEGKGVLPLASFDTCLLTRIRLSLL
jgi:hypothetical protein